MSPLLRLPPYAFYHPLFGRLAQICNDVFVDVVFARLPHVELFLIDVVV